MTSTIGMMTENSVGGRLLAGRNLPRRLLRSPASGLAMGMMSQSMPSCSCAALPRAAPATRSGSV
eukprot:5841009-Alexandrium_andersonii.AAC.1